MKWPWQRRKVTAQPTKTSDPFAYHERLYHQDPFLRLISPVGPMDTLEEHEQWYQYHLRQISLETVLEAVHEAHSRYPYALDEVQVVAYHFAELHPQHAAQIDDALRQAGFEGDD